MVTDVEEVFAVIVLPRTAIGEVDESVHSCQLCSEEFCEVFLEEVNSNGVMNIAVRYHNVADVGHTAVCVFTVVADKRVQGSMCIIPMKGLCLILHDERVVFCKVSDNKKIA